MWQRQSSYKAHRAAVKTTHINTLLWHYRSIRGETTLVYNLLIVAFSNSSILENEWFLNLSGSLSEWGLSQQKRWDWGRLDKSFFFCFFFNLKEDVQRKMIQIDFSNKVVLRKCEHMDLQDGHGWIIINTIVQNTEMNTQWRGGQWKSLM